MMCMNCTSDFSLTLRRHHCHGCGRVSHTQIKHSALLSTLISVRQDATNCAYNKSVYCAECTHYFLSFLMCTSCYLCWIYVVWHRLFVGTAPGTDIHWNTWETAWPKCAITVTVSWGREVGKLCLSTFWVTHQSCTINLPCYLVCQCRCYSLASAYFCSGRCTYPVESEQPSSTPLQSSSLCCFPKYSSPQHLETSERHRLLHPGTPVTWAFFSGLRFVSNIASYRPLPAPMFCRWLYQRKAPLVALYSAPRRARGAGRDCGSSWKTRCFTPTEHKRWGDICTPL